MVHGLNHLDLLLLRSKTRYGRHLASADVPQQGVCVRVAHDAHAEPKQGRGVKLLHHFGDPLWALGDKSTPDPSFTLARVFPQQVGRDCVLNSVTPAPYCCMSLVSSWPEMFGCAVPNELGREVSHTSRLFATS